MYLSGAHVLHTLHFLDAKRLIEFQQYQMLMEKQQHLFDPFEPIKRLEMAIIPKPRHPEKPLTSFRINDILADSSDSESSEISRNSSKKRIVAPSGINTDTKLNLDNGDNPQCSPQNEDHSIQERLKLHDSDIIRPWNCSPKSSASSDAEKDTTQTDSAIQNRSFLLKMCNKSRRCDIDSDEEEEIDVEACEEDSNMSLTSSDKDVSPLDALMAMSSKTFMGLESFGKDAF